MDAAMAETIIEELLAAVADTAEPAPRKAAAEMYRELSLTRTFRTIYCR